jgi:hypothetical protein
MNNAFHLKMIFCFFALMAISNLFGQRFPVTFGKVSKEEIDLKYYEKDPQADAVVLFDVGNVYFNSKDLDIVFERTTRIKIFKQSAFDIAEIEIPYYYEGNNIETIEELKAFTYNEVDGHTVFTALKPENIYDERINEYWKMKKFAFPDVKEGSIIEFKYVLVSPFMMRLRDWEFQRTIPTVFSQYIARMTPFYEYQFVLQGTERFSSQKNWVDEAHERSFAMVKFKDFVHEYIMTDVPAFKSEDYITSINDYIIKLDFQLSKINRPDGTSMNIVETWPKLIKELDTEERFGKYVDKAENSASRIFKISSLDGLSESEKFDKLVKFIKGNYNWNGYSGKYANENLNKFLEMKTGNTGNINLLLTGLLKAADIEAYPVILSTRDNGRVKDVPFLDFFNYVIVAAKIDGHTVLADATETFTTSENLPVRSLNEKGLMIKRDTVKWIQLNPVATSTIKRTFNIHFSEDYDTLKSVMVTEANAYDALNIRKEYFNDTEKLIQDCTESGYTVDIDSVKISNISVPDSSLLITFPLTLETERLGNRIFVAPFLDEPISKNLLIENTRTYPVDLIYPETREFISKIHLPENAKVVSLPSNANISNDSFSLEYNIGSDNSIITVSAEYQFKKSIYKPAEYLKVRFFFNEIIKALNNKIIIEVGPDPDQAN